jgi:hypothetical protein
MRPFIIKVKSRKYKGESLKNSKSGKSNSSRKPGPESKSEGIEHQAAIKTSSEALPVESVF